MEEGDELTQEEQATLQQIRGRKVGRAGGGWGRGG